jgi:nucleoside-diphosphate-sugar epimerase
MRIMVTGGAGFIGSAVVRHLVLETRAQVLTIDKLTYAGTRTSLKAVGGHPNHRFVQADICDEIAVGCAVPSFARNGSSIWPQRAISIVPLPAPRRLSTRIWSARSCCWNWREIIG